MQSYEELADEFLIECKQNSKKYRLSEANLTNRLAPCYRLPWWPEAIEYFLKHDGANIVRNGRKGSKTDFANDIFAKRVHQYFCKLKQHDVLKEFFQRHKQAKTLYKIVLEGFENFPTTTTTTTEGVSDQEPVTTNNTTKSCYHTASIETTDIEDNLTQCSRELEKQGYFDPKNEIDARNRILASIVQRSGQARFRNQLLKAYNNRCAITECNVIFALEAAHILPYKGEYTNDVRNGLLLRSDIHTLFDLGKLSINPENYCVVLCYDIQKTSYSSLHGKPIILPKNEWQKPDKEALDQHFKKLAVLWNK